MRPGGSKPTPTHLRLLRGNPGQRRLPNDPKPEIPAEAGDPPDFLGDYAAAEWRRVAPFLHRLRLLTVADLKVLEAYCVAYGRWRDAEDVLARDRAGDLATLGLMVVGRKGVMENPLVNISRKSCFEMLRYASEFGFSPATRARIDRPSPDDPSSDPFHGLIG